MQIKIEGNYMEHYNEETGSLEKSSGIIYSGAELIYIDEDSAVFEVDEYSRIARVNGIGGVEEIIYEGEKFE